MHFGDPATFFDTGADIAGITGPIRNPAERVKEATRLGAVAYVPSGRGGGSEEEEEGQGTEAEQGEMSEE